MPAENVPRYHKDGQKEDKNAPLRFQCPECHIPLVFFVAEKGRYPRFYFKYPLSEPESTRQRHLLCLQRGFEKHWVDQIPEEILKEILAFYDIEASLQHTLDDLSFLKHNMAALGQALQTCQDAVPGLKISQGKPSLMNNQTRGHFEMMRALHTKNAAFFDKEGPKILKGLGHLEETYLRFRQKIRHY